MLLMAIYAPTTVGADLYAMIIADTVSPTGHAAAMDLERVRMALKALSRHSGIKVHVQAFTGDQVTSNNLCAAVMALPVTSNDIAVFYYLGHGYRTSHKVSVWPYLYVCNDRTAIDLQLIVESFISKKPHMALIVADCCNNVMDDQTGVPWAGHPHLKKGIKKPGPGYRALFQNFEGIVVACASQAGDYAYCHSKGHFYTEAFLEALHEEIYVRNPQWSNLLHRASLKVQNMQIPYHEILLYP